LTTSCSIASFNFAANNGVEIVFILGLLTGMTSIVFLLWRYWERGLLRCQIGNSRFCYLYNCLSNWSKQSIQFYQWKIAGLSNGGCYFLL